MNEIEFVESIQALEIKPNDLIVIKAKEPLSAAYCVLLRDHVKRIIPEARCIILDADTDIGIIRGS